MCCEKKRNHISPDTQENCILHVLHCAAEGRIGLTLDDFEDNTSYRKQDITTPERRSTSHLKKLIKQRE